MIYAKKIIFVLKILIIDKCKNCKIVLYLIYLNIVTGSIPRGQ